MYAIGMTISIVSGLVLAIWTSRHLKIWKERREGFLLTAEYAGPPANPPKISVVVAAKDEQENIETCVRSMLAQDYPNFEMIVVNDRSGDNTAGIVERVAAEDSRLRLINITNLPEGWCGKNNAMQTGVSAATGEWVCLIDADCVQNSPRTLSTAVQYAFDKSSDLLSVLPVLTMKGFWENVVQPVCGGVMMIWFEPERVNNPHHRAAYANGAFMLMKKSAWQRIGTHEAVRDKVNEDMHLARLIKEHGLNLRVVRNRGLYSVRMYTSFRSILRGWSRIFFGTFGTLRRLMVSLLVLATMGLLPYIAAVLGLSLAGGTSNVWLACGLIGAAGAAMQLSVIYRFYKLIGARKELAWSYPIGCVVGIVAICMALGKLRKGAKLTWRGTSYVAPQKA